MRVGGFALRRELGRGGAAVVWDAVHLASGTSVALKAPRAPGLWSAFEQEISAMALLHHPGVVRILDRGAAAPGDGLPEGTPWLVMERAEGSLADVPAMDWTALQALLDGLLDALGHAHGQGVLHRDLKPANVLRVGAGFQLSDFGMARLADLDGGQGGTPGWMAPEQARGDAAREGPWTDLFALGHLAARLATDAPAAFQGWLAAAREPDPRRRFRCAAEARLALGRVQAGGRAVAAIPADAGPTVPSAGLGGPADAVPAVWHPTPAPEGLAPRFLPRPVAPGLGVQVLAARVLPVVGRDPERQALWEAGQDALSGGPTRAVAVEGAPGVGTSRLGAWLAAELHARAAADVVRVRCGPADALRVAVRRWTGGDPSTLLADLGHGGDLGEAVGAWLGGGALGPADAGRLAAELFAAFAEVRPLVVLLDDADRADPAEVRPLLRIPGRALTVVTRREDGRAVGHPADPQVRTVALGPLGADAVLEMLEIVVGLEPTLSAEIARASGGNPQLAALRVAGPWGRGDLEAGPEGLRLRAGAALDPPASAVDPWWATCLATVGDAPSTLEAVATAALFGASMPHAAWDVLCGAPELRAALIRGQLLVDDGVSLSWAHGLLREGAQAWARQTGRATALHDRIRAWWADRGDDARFGEHALRAGDAASAVAPLRRALFRAVSHGGPGEADHLDRLLDEAFAALPEPHPLRGEHLLEKARLRFFRYRSDPAEVLALTGAARRALSEAGDPGFLRVVYWLEAELMFRYDRVDEGRQRVEAALALSGGSPALRARLQRLRARAAYLVGDGQTARAVLVEALAATRAAGDGVGEGDVLATLGVVHHLAGDRAGAERLYAAAVQTLAPFAAGFGLGDALLNHAHCACEAGDLDRAEALVLQARRAMRAIGRDLLLIHTTTAMIARARGDIEAARAALARVQDQDSPIAPALGLEEAARDADPDAWDALWARGSAAVTPMADDVLASLERAADRAEALGWAARADVVRAAVAPARAVHARLRACGVRGVDDLELPPSDPCPTGPS